MAEVIQFEYAKAMSVRDLSEMTNDGKRTQRELIRKMKQIVHGVNTTDTPDEAIHEFLVRSFTKNGIMDTYNELGYCGWKAMITDMAEHEVAERSTEYGSIENTATRH